METAAAVFQNRIQEFKMLPARLLRPNPKNWRTHNKQQREALNGILSSIGMAGAIMVRPHGDAYQIIDGHLRAEEMIDQDVPCLILDVTDEEADALLASYDVLTKMADTEEDAFRRLVEDAIRRADDDLKEALIAVAKFEGITVGNQNPLMDAPDLAPIPALPEDPVTQLGDVWVLGQHRLICGDSTDGDVLDRLLKYELIAGVWTDPPYGVDYTGKTKDALKIENDGAADAITTFKAHLAVLYPRMMPAAPFYVAHPHGPISVEFGAAIIASGLLFHQTLIWQKDSMVLGHSDYHYQHEPIAYGWKPEEQDQAFDYNEAHTTITYGWKRQARSKRPWYAARKEVSIFQTERPTASKDHPTCKPVLLVEHHLRNSTRPGDMVFDGFTGSGSTMIACERLGRRFRGVELSPAYCDVAVLRWQDLTGQEAYREKR